MMITKTFHDDTYDLIFDQNNVVTVNKHNNEHQTIVPLSYISLCVTIRDYFKENPVNEFVLRGHQNIQIIIGAMGWFLIKSGWCMKFDWDNHQIILTKENK